MYILEKYIKGLSEFDADQIADLFTDDATFNDSAMTPFGADVIHFDGREAIREGFTGLLAAKNSFPKVLTVDETRMDYDIIAGEMTIPCRGKAVLYGDLIKSYTVIPRA